MNGDHTQAARRAAEQAARQSYGKLIAFLSARSRDIAAAEDALSEALATALLTWPERGVPENPEAWLLVTARRRLSHASRHGKVMASGEATILLAIEEAEDRMKQSENALFPDDRLKLLFACTHPAIDPGVRTGLMLQTVLGLDAGRIASAFLVAPSAMGQRLVRAKSRIRDAGIAFTVPERNELPARLDAVLAAIYAAYTIGWDGIDRDETTRDDLGAEALWLGRMLVSVLPGEPEPKALLALMLYSEARRPARRDTSGAYVPLDEQDPNLWDADRIEKADLLLVEAGGFNRFGRYQCEAAIQSVHAARRRTNQTDWRSIALLYEALLRMSPTIGAHVGQAAARAGMGDAGGALALLDVIPPADVASYQPFWAVRAHLLAMTGQAEQATDAYRRAIGLSDSDAVRRFLQARLDRLRS